MGSGSVVVLDTNILVSAFGWEGPERRVYRLARDGPLRAATSPELLAELARVLSYPKFGLDSAEIDAITREVKSASTVVAPARKIEAVPADPPDDRVLECAVAADAEWIVSGDQHLLTLESFEDISIVRAVTLLEQLGRTGG